MRGSISKRQGTRRANFEMNFWTLQRIPEICNEVGHYSEKLAEIDCSWSKFHGEWINIVDSIALQIGKF